VLPNAAGPQGVGEQHLSSRVDNFKHRAATEILLIIGRRLVNSGEPSISSPARHSPIINYGFFLALIGRFDEAIAQSFRVRSWRRFASLR
jgi:hypothetical protein